ncbi:MAG: hypothetical protein J0H67_10070 [Rhodospirillales bacterium]|nr:hypothetical protein [Rhodospirillales bacterium]
MQGLATDPHALRVLARQAQDPVAFQVLLQTAEELEAFLARMPRRHLSATPHARPAST